jgi:hypothetical protein
MAIGAVASFILARLYLQHFHGAGLGQRDALEYDARAS